MTDVIQLGPFNLYIPYVASIIAIVISVFTASYFGKFKLQTADKKATDLVLEYWIVFILVWKLSYFLMYPQDLLNYPLAVVYFDGGSIGLLLGLFIIVLYMFFQRKRNNINFSVQVLLMIQALLVYLVIDTLVEAYYRMNIYMFMESIAYIAVVVTLFWRRKEDAFLLGLKFTRWTALVWIAFRVLTDQLHLHTTWLIVLIIFAFLNLMIEWKWTKVQEEE
ncbi:hypothetical protein [Halalkalibacillus halophilus]|uniref:hypothetical protein n=1 Tax=Halalkalibacillus halophilus TaxID=392827 RepID=UPI00041532C6|nr:hypothetical protein [Halalkalibacillus halophilus]